MYSYLRVTACTVLLFVFVAVLISACKENPVDDGPDDDVKTSPTPSTEIGPDGGTATSQDERLTLHIPAGALESTQSITIGEIARDDLGPEFAEIIDKIGVEKAYELGPDGLTFLRPITVRFESEQTPGRNRDSLAITGEFLFTTANGSVEPLDSLRVEIDDDESAVTISGQLDHFTPLATSQANNGVSFFIHGVPEQLDVGNSFQAEVVIAGSAAGDLAEFVTVLGPATYRDESSAPVEPAFDPPFAELSEDGAERYAQNFEYTCAEAGLGVYGADLSVRVRFDLDSGSFTAESYADFVTTVDCVAEMPSPDTVRVALAGEGSGKITSNPAGIDCPDDCEEPFERGTAVTLTATPDEGSVFTTWSGDASDYCVADPVCTVPVDAGTIDITATFDPAPEETALITDFVAEPVDDFTIRFNLTLEYSLDYSDLNVTIDPDDGSGPQDVQLEETDAENEYTGRMDWEYDEGAMFPVTPRASVTTSDDGESVDEVLSIEKVTLTLIKDGDGEGTVRGVADWGSDAILCAPGCFEDTWTGLRSAGMGVTRVALSASPESASTFDGWSGDLVGSEGCTDSPECVVTMSDDRTVRATFNSVEGFETGVLFLALIGQPEALMFLQGRSAGKMYGQLDDVAFGDISGRFPVAIAGGEGIVVVDLLTNEVLLDMTDLDDGGPFFGVAGATQSPAGPTSSAMLLAFGADGQALFRFDQVGAIDLAGTTYDAFPAGGNVESDVVSFVQPGIGVGFYVYDESQNLYIPAEVQLDDALFEGELASAYLHSDELSDDVVPQPRGSVLVLTRDVESGLYLARWDGADPVRIADVGLDARKIRCIDPGAGDLICGISVFGEDRLAIFKWDGENAPESAGQVSVGDGPVDLDLTLLPSGNIGVVMTGFYDHSVTEVELSPSGSLVNSFTRPVLSGCMNPGHAIYVRDANGLKVVGTCYGSDAYFIDESVL